MSTSTKIDKTHIIILIAGILLGALLVALPARNALKYERGKRMSIEFKIKSLITILKSEDYTQKNKHIAEITEYIEASLKRPAINESINKAK